LALANGLKMAQTMKPDAVELMPGVIPKVVSAFADALPDIPLIASGLIQTEDEANGILDAGATALSVSERALWNFEYGK